MKPDPLTLPSGGQIIEFGDTAKDFKPRHFRALADVFAPDAEGSVMISDALTALRVGMVMAEALIKRWAGMDHVPGAEQAIPRDRPELLEELSHRDQMALSLHLTPFAFDAMGLTVTLSPTDEVDPGKDLSSSRSDETPGTGWSPNSAAGIEWPGLRPNDDSTGS